VLENKPNYRKIIQYLLFAAAVVWIAIGLETWSDQKAGVRPLKDRTRMADLVFPQLEGGAWRLSEHRGQVVLINYWAGRKRPA
jgi:cytochrome c biogenesis protein CcmG/thiol:disulfide interchange protein DsbE